MARLLLASYVYELFTGLLDDGGRVFFFKTKEFDLNKIQYRKVIQNLTFIGSSLAL